MPDLVDEILGIMRHDVERIAHQTKRNSMLIAVAALLGLTAYVAGICAAVIYAARYYDEVAVLVVILLAAILGILAILVALRILDKRDRRAARASSARLRMVTTIGSAILPALFRSKALTLTAAAGSIAYIVSGFLGKRTRVPRKIQPASRTQPPASQEVTNGAINPYTNYSAQKPLR